MNADCMLLTDRVAEMRRLQREYFKTKRLDVLQQSKEAERQVDALLDRLRGGQLRLFSPTEANHG